LFVKKFSHGILVFYYSSVIAFPCHVYDSTTPKSYNYLFKFCFKDNKAYFY